MKAALTPHRGEAGITVEEDRVVFKTIEEARKHIPSLPDRAGFPSTGPCAKCSGPMREVVFTTAGAGDQVRVWRAHPLAVDGWLCTSCGYATGKRRMSPAEITRVLETGVLHANESRLDDAEYWFLRAVSSWPAFPPALANLAQVYLQRADSGDGDADALRKEAVRLLRKAAASREHCPPQVVVELSRTEALLGEESAGLARLDELVADEGGDAAVRERASSLARDIRMGKALITRATELASGLLYLSDAPRRALDDEARQRLASAMTLLNDAAGRDARSFATWFFLGKVYQRLGDHPASRRAFGRAVDVEPDRIDGLREYASACLDVGDAGDALPIAERACSLQPADSGLRANLALVQLFAGDLPKATHAIEEAARLDPDDKITASLARLIREVVEGRRTLPRTLAELEGRR
jgi:tetratricopeptide (TPR) repeat protein